MKKAIIILLFTSIAFACKKEQAVLNNGITGKWELTDSYNGLGLARGIWVKVDNNMKHAIEFKTNGTFISNAQLYYNANAYELQDDSSIIFLNASEISGDLRYYYTLEQDNSILTISPHCLEGCAYRYKAIR